MLTKSNFVILRFKVAIDIVSQNYIYSHYYIIAVVFSHNLYMLKAKWVPTLLLCYNKSSGPVDD